MALKNKAIIYIILSIVSNICFAKVQLPELMAKQATANVRFISNDGKFTYYQKRSGSLFISTNYKVTVLLNGASDTQYTVSAGEARRKILITQNENFHNFFSVRNLDNIYLSDYGSTVTQKIGEGLSAKLHLADKWISYFAPIDRSIHFEHTESSALKFSIRINNTINPYFVPEVVFADENNIFYTDLGANGVPAIIHYKRNVKTSDIIYQKLSSNEKISLCLFDSTLYISEVGFNTSIKGSTLSRLYLPIKNFKDKEIIYTSELNDTGNLVCNDLSKNIYFIKNTTSQLTPVYEVAELNPSTRKITLLSDQLNVSTLINMDGTLLTFKKGTYYILKGNTDFKSSDSLKQKSKSSKNEESSDE